MAHQRLDDRATQDVVGRQLDAAEYRQGASIDGVVVLVGCLDVLVVARPNLADRRNTEGEHVAIGVGRIALEITVQAALTPGDGRSPSLIRRCGLNRLGRWA